MSDRTIFYVGHDDRRRQYVVNEEILEHAKDIGYDFLTSPITTTAYQTRVLEMIDTFSNAFQEEGSHYGVSNHEKLYLSQPLASNEANIFPNEAVSQMLYTTSRWIDVASSDPLISDVSRQVLCQEVSYAAWSGASNIVIEGPRADAAAVNVVKFARAVKEALSLGNYINIQIRLPIMFDQSVSSATSEKHDLFDEAESEVSSEELSSPDWFSSWDMWNTIRTVCDYSSRVSVALVLTSRLPIYEVQSRWMSEPLRVLELPATVFVGNKHRIQVLPRLHQQLITKYMTLRIAPWILLSGIGSLPGLAADGSPSSGFDSPDSASAESSGFASPVPSHDPLPSEVAKWNQLQKTRKKKEEQPYLYIEYVRKHLQAKQLPKTAMERFGSGYQDYLQSPLQPLTDNLESVTYEVFEKDPIKYEWYERAIHAALLEWHQKSLPTSHPKGKIVVAVVGAGRGPLVARALQAAATSGVQVDMWALEKNPSAFVLLQKRNLSEWDRRVSLVHSDMRKWPGPEYEGLPMKIDILVSELLGSFGDNELSPECLDGVQHLLAPHHGISVPSSYTAHVTPISSPKLYADIKAREATGDSNASQIPYVVMLQACDYLSTAQTHSDPFSHPPLPKVRQAWEFSHPFGHYIETTNAHNTRFSTLRFPCKYRGICHGLAGYFETVLWKRSFGSSATHANGSSYSRTADRGSSLRFSDSETDVARFDDPDDETYNDFDSSRDSAVLPEQIELSINPLTMDAKSKDMISWFPAYLPLRTPLYIPDNSEIVVNIWRQTDGRQVWYEWYVEVISITNPGMRLGNSELHSSVKNACLI